MPQPQHPPPKERFTLLRSRRFLIYAGLFGAFCIFLYSGGAANYAASRARAALVRRDIDSAQEWLDFANWLDDGHAEVAFLQARIHRKHGNIEEVHRWLIIAQKRGWDKEAIRREEIIMFAQAGQLRQAEPWLPELILSPGDDAQEICEAFVNGFYLNNNLRKANALITSWMGDFPEDPQPWVFRAKIKQSTDQYAAAEEDFREALKRDPTHLEAIVGLGEVLLKQLQPEEALDTFREGLAEDSNLNAARAGAAKALIVLGKPDQALKELDQILNAEPDNDSALLERGKLHLAAQSNEAAVKDFEALCRLRSGGVAHRYQLALALRASGREDEATEHFEYVTAGQAALRHADEITYRVTKDPTDLKTRTELGIIYLKYADPLKGIAWLRAVLNENPRNREALDALAKYYRSCTHLGENYVQIAERYEEARDNAGPASAGPASSASGPGPEPSAGQPEKASPDGADS